MPPTTPRPSAELQVLIEGAVAAQGTEEVVVLERLELDEVGQLERVRVVERARDRRERARAQVRRPAGDGAVGERRGELPAQLVGAQHPVRDQVAGERAPLLRARLGAVRDPEHGLGGAVPLDLLLEYPAVLRVDDERAGAVGSVGDPAERLAHARPVDRGDLDGAVLA